MPIVAEIMIEVKRDKNGLVEILKNTIHRCGCVDLVVESERLETPLSDLLKVMQSVDGVVCNDENVCCVADVSSFAEKLKKFRGDS